MNIPYLRIKGQEPKTNLATVVIWISDKTVERMCSNEIGQSIGSTAICHQSVIWPPWSLMSAVQIHLFLLSIARVTLYKRPVRIFYPTVLGFTNGFPPSRFFLLGYSNVVHLGNELYTYLGCSSIAG